MASDRPSLSPPQTSPSSSHGSARALRLLAPAKVNLHLRVGPPRADGFHPLLTWMCTASLFDTLTIEARPPEAAGERGEASPPNSRGRADEPTALLEGRDSAAPEHAAAGEAGAVSLTCDLPGLPCDADNLVVRIARAWLEQRRQQQAELRRLGESAGGGRGEAIDAAAAAAAMAARNAGGQDGTVRRLSVALGKRIPVGAGLGGGSSDAARTLLALDRLSNARLAAEDLSAFAARFGSDLSFFVYPGGSAVCHGRGEQVMPIAAPTARWAVLLLPQMSMPTPAVYRKFDEMRLGRSEHVERAPDWAAWAKMPAKYLLGCLVNDLEAPAFAIAPQLGKLASGSRTIARPAGADEREREQFVHVV